MALRGSFGIRSDGNLPIARFPTKRGEYEWSLDSSISLTPPITRPNRRVFLLSLSLFVYIFFSPRPHSLFFHLYFHSFAHSYECANSDFYIPKKYSDFVNPNIFLQCEYQIIKDDLNFSGS